MACNTKPGPAMAIRFIEENLTGVKLTQKDWHTLREAAAGGEKLSNAAADDAMKAHAARALADSLRVTKLEADEFVLRFMGEKSTEGTCKAMQYVAENGIPAEILTRPRRNRGREVPRPRQIMNVDDSKHPVVVKDSTPSGVVVNGVNQRMPLYRVTYQGKLIGVSLSQAHAEKLAARYPLDDRR